MYKRQGVDWADLAEEQIELYRTDMAALRVLPPVELTGVVESLDLVVDLIGVLRDEQAVYQVPDPEYPDWYFSVTKASNLMQGTGTVSYTHLDVYKRQTLGQLPPCAKIS